MTTSPSDVLPNLLPDNGFNCLVQGRHGMLLCNRNDVVVGQSVLRYGEYFESEVDIFNQIILPGAQVADIGANIGTHTIALAHIVTNTGWVYAFEPQRLVFQTLCANVALNSLVNVDCLNMAVADQSAAIPVEELDPNAQNNFGGLSLGHSLANRSVYSIKIDEYLDGVHLDFMKIDVQGMEESCLRGARETLKKYGTIVYLENDQPEKSASLISYLHEMNYTAFWHLPPFFNPNNFAGNPNNIHPVTYIDNGGQHLECLGFAINMLCVPKSRCSHISGLFEVTDINEHPLHRQASRFHPAVG